MTPDALTEALQARGADLSPLQQALLDRILADRAAAPDLAPHPGTEEVPAPPDGEDPDRAAAQTDLIGRFAAAIGACPCCFGTDAGCPVCAGRGAPGARRPDPDGFAFFIAPVLARRARRTAAPGARAARPHPRRSRWDGASLLEGDET